ncbi:hypothetical protein [Desulfobotulus mexicanus]|uniref:Type VI lipoprotein IgE-like C-terminal domain-containing protein n=1 Tax=Desulfobotulus mexicanus TaxID=2586642 RepID=A0A5S5MDW1_9BACT|nr:hypothetical protein [Desulfobotulus mexicanus]TYT73918.1 hypothetical protein FIM25_12830 [Desulfobotulus mexicanus]
MAATDRSGSLLMGNTSDRRAVVHKPLLFLLPVLLIFLSATGCGKPWQTAPGPQMLLRIQAMPDANRGRIFYMLVRETTEKQYLTESYAEIAALVFSEPGDPSVLGVFSLVPGKKAEFRVAMPEQNPVAFYFLFTEPSEDWNHMMPLPLKPSYEILIQERSVTIDDRSPGDLFGTSFFGG